MSNLPWSIKVWFYLSFIMIMIFFIDLVIDLRKFENVKFELSKKELNKKWLIYCLMALSNTVLFLKMTSSFSGIVMGSISVLIGVISSYFYIKFLQWVGK